MSESTTESKGRIWTDEDGQRHIKLMKGLVVTPKRLVYMIIGLIALFAVPDISRFTPLSLRAVHHGLAFGLAALGVNLLLRHTREVSFGHAAFFGTGAYTMAVMSTYFGVSGGFLLIIAGTVAATIMAVIIGFLTLRHRDIYFALLTLAFGQLLYALAHGLDYFGGSDGLPVRPQATGGTILFAGIEFGFTVYDLIAYYVTAAAVVLALIFVYRIVRSPYGRALDAIGQNRTRATFLGINTDRYMWRAFIISGMLAGLGGTMFAVFQQYVRPTTTLFFLRSGDILFMAILGGFHTLLGPIVGGVILEILLQSGRFYTQYFNALTGFVLLIVVYFLPEGVVGSLQRGSDIRQTVAQAVQSPGDFASDMRQKTEAWLHELRHTIIGGR